MRILFPGLLATTALAVGLACTPAPAATSTPAAAAITPVVTSSPVTTPASAATSTPASAPAATAKPATTTAPPAASGLAQCIVGSWEVPDVNAYYQQAFAQLLPAGTPITDLTASGISEYSFFADGRGTGNVDITARANLAGAGQFTFTIKGPGEGRWRAEGTTLVLDGSPGGTNNVLVSASLGTVTLFPPRPIGSLFGGDAGGSARSNASCNQTTLTIQVVDPPNAPTVTMRRK